MKIVVLSTNPKLYSTRRLMEAGRERGHQMVVLNHKRCYMNITSHKPSIHFKGEAITAVLLFVVATGLMRGSSGIRLFVAVVEFLLRLLYCSRRRREVRGKPTVAIDPSRLAFKGISGVNPYRVSGGKGCYA